MSTQAEKIYAQVRAFSGNCQGAGGCHLTSPGELTMLFEAREILKELIPHAESMGKFCEDYGPGGGASGKVESLIRRAKEVV